MEKSRLLEKILKNAEELCRSHNHGMSADYFIVALLNEVANPDAEDLQEIEKVKATLEKFGFDIKETAQKMCSELKDSSDGFGMGGLILNKVNFEAEQRARRSKMDKIDCDLFLDLILAEPTEAVAKYILEIAPASAVSEEDAKEAEEKRRKTILELIEEEKNKKAGQDEDDGDEVLDLFAVDEDDEDEDDEEEDDSPVPDFLERYFGESEKKKKKEPKDEYEGLTGLERLVKSVDKVKSVQQSLLSTVFGQDRAVDTFVSGYFQAELVTLTQSKRTRPRATFLFAGPPGVGKTFLAEQSAEVLGLPYRRFDMSEYSDKEANLEFCGSDQVYKNAKEGNVTGFVAENPKCILLFDEVEKAHLNVIHLFLQILDAGKLRDNYTDNEVSFSDAIIIFTTNAGKQLYDDPTVANLSSVSRKTILKALSSDLNPNTGTPLFPPAICSRFASGNVIMFNHLDAHNLLHIVERELNCHMSSLSEKTGIAIDIDKNIPYTIMFSEGGKADARTMRGKAVNFYYQEIYELFRLIASDKNGYETKDIKKIKFNVSLPADDEKVLALFSEEKNPEVLVFASGKTASACRKYKGGVKLHFADDVNTAKEILFNNDINIILCDVRCHVRKNAKKVLNLEDIDSVGRDFFLYVREYVNTPLYLLQSGEEISPEEFLSFSRDGARGIVVADESFGGVIREKCNISKQQNSLLELAKANKVVNYSSSQSVVDGGKTAVITLYDFKLSLALDAEDSKNVLSNVSRPDITFDKVIGAKDAKDELSYFVEYMKNPAKLLKKGVRAPKGILLYGPPGTGKTLLAKAMAGESDVTFISAEGNQFLKKYVGEGASSVHEIFNVARKYAPSIPFIDEIDAIGKSRENDAHGITSDVLTSFLTEMDGFNSKPDKPVFVLAATNYGVEEANGRELDPALLRRFDRKILVDLPNKDERKQYISLKVGQNTTMHISDEQIENIAVRSTGMSLAELESVIELALRNAIKSKDYTVDDEALENAFELYNSGDVKKWSADALERTARHEAGHALMCWLGGETPSYLTVVARGSHGGYMQHADSEGKGLYTKDELLNKVRTALGGRASEVVYYGERDGLSTGASGDLYSATKLVEQMICSYGMDGETGLSSINANAVANTPYYAVLRERVNAVLKEEFEIARRAIDRNRMAIDKLVELLLSKNNLKGKEIDEVLSGIVKDRNS